MRYILGGAFLTIFLFLASLSFAQGATTLGWDKNAVSTDAGINATGYKVHIGTVSGTYTQHIDVGNVTTYVPTTLTAGTKYFASVTAYNAAKIEGALSNEISFTPPVPTPTPTPTPVPTPAPTPAAPLNLHIVITVTGTGLATVTVSGTPTP